MSYFYGFEGHTMQKWKSTFAVLAAIVFSPAFASPVTFTAALSGANELPPNSSAGSGNVEIVFDLALHSMEVTTSFLNLTAPTTAAHIHCCTAVAGTGNVGVATTVPNFAGFPLGVITGTYAMTFDMTMASSYNPVFVTAQGTISAAELALYDGLVAGEAYFNVHSAAFPAGEIRGFLVQAQASEVPEPATLWLVLPALLGATRVRTGAAAGVTRAGVKTGNLVGI